MYYMRGAKKISQFFRTLRYFATSDLPQKCRVYVYCETMFSKMSRGNTVSDCLQIIHVMNIKVPFCKKYVLMKMQKCEHTLGKNPKFALTLKSQKTQKHGEITFLNYILKL